MKGKKLNIIQEKFEISEPEQLVLNQLADVIYAQAIKVIFYNIKNYNALQKIRYKKFYILTIQWLLRFSKKILGENKNFSIMTVQKNYRYEITDNSNTISTPIELKFVSDVSQGDVDAYYSVNKNTIYISLVDNFDRYLWEYPIHDIKNTIKEYLEHEYRHSMQVTSKQKNYGMGKLDAIRTTQSQRNFDILSKLNYGKIDHHATRPLEFKTNIYTYAFHIKKFLNYTENKNHWKNLFKWLFSNEEIYLKSDGTKITKKQLNGRLTSISLQLNKVKSENLILYRDYIVEIYKLIFNQ